MDVLGAEICRLCLEIVYDQDNCTLIESNIKNMLKPFFPELSLYYSKRSIGCNYCLNILRDMYDIKTKCSKLEEGLQYYSKLKRKDAVTINDFVDRFKESDVIRTEKNRICRTCLKEIESNNCIALNQDTNGYLSNVLKICLPEVTTNVIIDPLMCETCYKLLQKMFIFINQCLDAERKIQLFIQSVGGNIEEVDLHTVKEFYAQENNSVSVKDQDEGYLNMEVKSEILLVDPRDPDKSVIKVALRNGIYSSSISQKISEEMRKTGTNMYNCVLCNHNANQQEDLLLHLKQIHGNNEKQEPEEAKKFHCPDCTYRTKYKGALKRHSLIHKKPEDIDYFYCFLCPYKAVLKHQLTQHLVVHNPVVLPTIYCALCEFQTTRKEVLKRHVTRIHIKNRGTSIKCDLCDYTTYCSVYFKKHSLIHSKVRVYKYDNVDNNLIVRMPDGKNFQCAVCKYISDRRDRIRRHIHNVHNDTSNSNTLSCSLCPYKCKEKYNLNVHMLKHKDPTELDMFKCSYCEYQTKYAHHIKRHERTHLKKSAKGKITPELICVKEEPLEETESELEEAKSKEVKTVTIKMEEAESEDLLHRSHDIFVINKSSNMDSQANLKPCF